MINGSIYVVFVYFIAHLSCRRWLVKNEKKRAEKKCNKKVFFKHNGNVVVRNSLIRIFW